MLIREATEADLGGILGIYNDAVVNTTAVWNDTPFDLEDRRRWYLHRRSLGYPVLVAVEGGEVLGFGSFGDFRAFHGYRHTVEHSLYVRRDRQRQGIGGRLLQALMERARDMGKHVMIAGIEAGNLPSMQLHARWNFKEVARMEQVGTKFGRWLDLVFMQLILDDQPPRG